MGLDKELVEADQALARAREAEEKRQQMLEEELRRNQLEDDKR